jgi:hypothetical protein
MDEVKLDVELAINLVALHNVADGLVFIFYGHPLR